MIIKNKNKNGISMKVKKQYRVMEKKKDLKKKKNFKKMTKTR